MEGSLREEETLIEDIVQENQEYFRERVSPLPVTHESINERADMTQTIAYFEETSKMNTEAILAIYQKIDELQEKIGSH